MWLSAARQIARGVARHRRLDAGVRILAYHGVVERYQDARVEESFHLLADFRAHVAVLRRLPVISLDEVDDARTERLPRIAITFDDGFANNLLAAELLDAAKLPATFFVATQNVEAREPIWPTLLRLVLARGSARRVELAGIRYELDAPGAARAVRDTFKQLARRDREAQFAELLSQLAPGELPSLVAELPSIAMMSWDDVRALARAGFTVGSHGRVHELQHAAQPEDVRADELAGSKLDLERRLGGTCDAFAFPNGTYHAASSAEVRAAGYTRAFTMDTRSATAKDHPLALPRLVANGGGDQLLTKLVFGN